MVVRVALMNWPVRSPSNSMWKCVAVKLEFVVAVSGLTGAGHQLTPYEVATWDNLWTDEMKLVRKRVQTSGGDNLPTLRGAAEHLDAAAVRRE